MDELIEINNIQISKGLLNITKDYKPFIQETENHFKNFINSTNLNVRIGPLTSKERWIVHKMGDLYHLSRVVFIIQVQNSMNSTGYIICTKNNNTIIPKFSVIELSEMFLNMQNKMVLSVESNQNPIETKEIPKDFKILKRDKKKKKSKKEGKNGEENKNFQSKNSQNIVEDEKKIKPNGSESIENNSNSSPQQENGIGFKDN